VHQQFVVIVIVIAFEAVRGAAHSVVRGAVGSRARTLVGPVIELNRVIRVLLPVTSLPRVFIADSRSVFQQ
jgi:hypothetical protein